MKGRNIEKKIYECLGVNIFRKCLLVIDKLAKLLHLDIEYKINNKTIEGLEEFKSKKTLLGTTHIVLLLGGLWVPSLNSIIWILLNIYCVIVQRYDYIRVDEILKKNERLEQKKKEKLEIAIDVDSKQQEEEGEKENLLMLNNIFQDATIEQQNQLLESLVQYYDIVHGNTEESTNTSQGYCKKMKNNL